MPLEYWFKECNSIIRDLSSILTAKLIKTEEFLDTQLDIRVHTVRDRREQRRTVTYCQAISRQYKAQFPRQKLILEACYQNVREERLIHYLTITWGEGYVNQHVTVTPRPRNVKLSLVSISLVLPTVFSRLLLRLPSWPRLHTTTTTPTPTPTPTSESQTSYI